MQRSSWPEVVWNDREFVFGTIVTVAIPNPLIQKVSFGSCSQTIEKQNLSNVPYARTRERGSKSSPSNRFWYDNPTTVVGYWTWTCTRMETSVNISYYTLKTNIERGLKDVTSASASTWYSIYDVRMCHLSRLTDVIGNLVINSWVSSHITSITIDLASFVIHFSRSWCIQRMGDSFLHEKYVTVT